MAGPYRMMKRVQEPAPYRWQRQQQGTGSTKAGAPPAPRVQPVGDNAKALRMAEVRHIVEKNGGNWTGLVCLGQALSIADDVTQIVGGGLYKKLAEATKRIAELEKQVTGMQAKVDHVDKHALTYSGEWQPTSTYYPGNAVSHKGQLYTALKHVIPGRSAPSSRDGSGWALMV